MIDKALISLLVMILPATIGLVGLSEGITALIYQRNAFSDTDTWNTASALQMYSVGLLFFSLVNVLTRVFHADKDTKTPVKCAFFGFAANLILNLILMKPMGHSGIALASSIAALINSVLLYVKIPDYRFSLSDNKILIIKILFANIAMFCAMMGGIYANIQVLINIGICCLVYFVVLYAMRINILRLLR